MTSPLRTNCIAGGFSRVKFRMPALFPKEYSLFIS